MLAFGSNTLGYRTSHMSSRGTPVRSYDRTWEEIENMLNKAEAKRAEWKVWFEECRRIGRAHV